VKFPKPQRQVSKSYINWIKSLSCCICGRRGLSDPHHVNMPGHSGMSRKPDDSRAVPLCHRHHVEYHAIGKKTFADKYDRDFEVIIDALNRMFERNY